MASKVVVAGSIAIDRIMSFNGYYRDLIEPAALHILSVSVLADSLQVAHGGTGANIAYSLAALGEKPILVATAGQDATDYVKQLQFMGVDTAAVHFSKLPTATFQVLTDSDGNQVGSFYPGAMADSASLSFEPWAHQDALFWVSPNGPDAMRRQVEQCARLGLRMAYDPGQQTSVMSPQDMRDGIEAAEIVIINEYELKLLSSRTDLSPETMKAKVPLFITTKGENGSIIEGTKLPKPLVISRVDADPVVDPTGAGDAYRAGFIYGYLRGWDVRQCGQLGSAVASIVLEQAGPQARLDPVEIARRYKAAFKEAIKLVG